VECATNIIEATTTTTSKMPATATAELETPEEEYVSQSKFEEFINHTLSKFD
jgi:hypothetical protein